MGKGFTYKEIYQSPRVVMPSRMENLIRAAVLLRSSFSMMRLRWVSMVRGAEVQGIGYL